MATPTYVPLGTITLASTDSEIVFSSIPATYRDLILIADMIGSGTSNNGYVGIRLNSDTGNNYSRVYMVGTGSSAVSASEASTNYFNTLGFPGSTSGGRANGVLQFMDYSATDKHKTIIGRENSATQNTSATAARWANTSAITSIQLNALINSFGVGSTFSLFGVN